MAAAVVLTALGSILQQNSIRTQHESVNITEKLDSVEVAWNVLCIAVELEGLTSVGGLEDHS